MPTFGADVHTARDIDPSDPSNIRFWLAFEFIQAAPHSSILNDVALMNMRSMLVTLDTFHCEMSTLNDVAPMNKLFISLTLDTSHLEMSLANDFAPMNMPFMSVTCDTFHSDKSL